MTHSRTAIRNAVASALAADPAVAAIVGPRVYKCRITPPRVGAEIPCLNIMTADDAVELDSEQSSPRRLWHTLTLTIEAVGYGAQSTLPDALDALCEAVEHAMMQDETFGGTASDSWITGTEIAFSEEGQQHLGVATLSYRVEYDEVIGTDSSVLSDFDTAEIRFNLGGTVQLGDEASDFLENIHE